MSAEPQPHASDPAPPHEAFPVAGVGASAGGVEALTQLVSALPSEPNLALVIVLHLDPSHESRLAELLGRAAHVPVVEAAHGQRIERGHVYVSKPGTEVAITDGTLAVTPRSSSNAPHYSIDHFFRSLAVIQGGRAVGVVLSGTGSDGTLGLAEIRAAGGVTFAQDPGTAKFADMPRSAAESGMVDFVLPPAKIAEQIVSIGQRAAEQLSGAREPEADEAFTRVLGILGTRTGVDFQHYRDTTIKRRMARRALLRGVPSIADYARFLEEHPEEVDALYRDVLINVTSFFRDKDVFAALAEKVFPAVLAARKSDEPIRVWVPGCSTGQEAYSLAMALLEFLDGKARRPAIQVFATDLGDQATLDKARLGVYPESIEEDVSPERLRRFFVKEGSSYRVQKTLRDLCVFARQNITVDPPFSRVDLVSCRNVLIYMSPVLQRRVIPIFHFALNIPGYLLLGPAETVGEFSDLFEVVSGPYRIYAKKPAAARPVLSLLSDGATTMPRPGQERAGLPAARNAQREADRLLLSRYAPPAVLVNDRFVVMQFFGKTRPFLEAPSGEPTTDVLRMAREGLFLDLRGALAEAQTTRGEVVRERLTVVDAGVEHTFTLRVLPVGLVVPADRCYLVIFEGMADQAQAAMARAPGPPATEAELARAQQELIATKEYLASIVDQEESINQELRSAHEEVLSSNEELQSTNEELETAKEELQSSNEELITVNEQLQQRNHQLDAMTADLSSFLANAGLPMVILGRDLTVRHLTPAAKGLFNLQPADVGRPFANIKTSLVVDDLSDAIAKVIATAIVWERELQDTAGHWWMLRIRPFHATSGAIEGAVVFGVDLDQLRRAQEFKDARDHATAIVQTIQKPLVVFSDGRRVEMVNRAFCALFGVAPADVEGRTLDEVAALDLGAVGLGPDLDALATRGQALVNREVTHEFPGLGRRTMVLDAQAILNTTPSLLLLAIDDITEQRATETLRVEAETLRQMERRKDEFLSILAHELRNPLAPILTALDVLRLSGEAHRAKAHAIAERQVRHLVRIVDDLLDVSRIAQGKVELRKERIQLGDVINAAVEISRPFIESAGQVLTVSIPDETVFLSADPIRLSQVLINLLNNAGKFSGHGGHIWLMVEILVIDGASSSVRIRVRDTGIGMGPDLVPHVFDMFVQGDHSLERRYGGLGIGLTLAHKLITLHGGTIAARSDGLGLGSEFVITLPVESGAIESTPAPALVAPSGPPLRILLVDDDADSREIMTVLLETAGHSVASVSDGAAAIREATAIKPDVAILDLSMPGVNGYDVARRLRQMPGTAKMTLIAMSGLGGPEHGRHAREAGFDASMQKPASAETLLRTLTQAWAIRGNNPTAQT